MGNPTGSRWRGRRRRSQAAETDATAGRGGRVARAESLFARLAMTVGILGIGTALGAILAGQDVEGWITGLVVSAVSVVLAAILWSARTG